MARFLVHESVKESVVRLYETSDAETGQEAYNKRLKYDVEFTIDWMTPTAVYISGLMSRVHLASKDFEDLKDYIRSKGVKEIWQERDGIVEVEYL